MTGCNYEEFPGNIQEETVKLDLNYTIPENPSDAEDYSGTDIPANNAGILSLYKDATDKVKQDSAGFIRSDTYTLTDVKISDTGNILINSAVDFLDRELTDTNNTTVNKDDDVACRTFFPVYNTDNGCIFYNGTSLSYANGTESDNIRRLTLYLNNTQPYSSEWNEFIGILSPFTKNEFLNVLHSFIPVITTDSKIEDINYLNCTIECEMQCDTDQLIYLTHKIITNFKVSSQTDNIFTKNDITIQGTLIEYRRFDSFTW